MKHSFFRALILAACTAITPISVPTAHATLFTFLATMQQGTLSGAVNIDPVAGLVTSGNFAVVLGGNTYSFTGAPTSQGPIAAALTPTENAIFLDSSGDHFQLALPESSFKGYAGSALCSFAFRCVSSGTSFIPSGFIGASGSFDAVQSGSLLAAAAAATPEPGSWVLLATGLFGMTGTLLKRPRHPGSQTRRHARATDEPRSADHWKRLPN